MPLGEGYFGYLASVLGKEAEARVVVGQLQARRETGYSSAIPIAWTYLGIGEVDICFQWLETALDERDPFLGSLIAFPAYDPIRDQPRFKRLVRELKLRT